VHTNVKTLKRNKLWLKTLVDSKCTHNRTDKQLVKEEQIKTELIDRLFKVFDADGTKNRKMTRFILLELEINGYTEKIDIVVINLNSTDMFLEYDWLVKHNPEVNWDKETHDLQDLQEIAKYNIMILYLY